VGYGYGYGEVQWDTAVRYSWIQLDMYGFSWMQWDTAGYSGSAAKWLDIYRYRDDTAEYMAPAPGMVIQHMCIEPVFIFFICKTSNAPAAGSDQKNKKKNQKHFSILQYTAVYSSILDAARVPPPYSLYHSPRTQNTRRHPSASKASRLAGWRRVALRSAWQQQLVPGLRPPPADPACR